MPRGLCRGGRRGPGAGRATRTWRRVRGRFAVRSTARWIGSSDIRRRPPLCVVRRTPLAVYLMTYVLGERRLRVAEQGCQVSPIGPSHWSGIFPAALTMFRRDGRLDVAASAAHVSDLISQGADGIVIAGTSGEFI